MSMTVGEIRQLTSLIAICHFDTRYKMGRWALNLLLKVQTIFCQPSFVSAEEFSFISLSASTTYMYLT